MWGKYCGLGAIGCVGLGLAFVTWNQTAVRTEGASSWNLEKFTEVLTPQFFADEAVAPPTPVHQQEEAPWDDGLSAHFDARPVDGSMESRPDELLRSAEGVGDVDENGRDKGRRSPPMGVEVIEASTDVS